MTNIQQAKRESRSVTTQQSDLKTMIQSGEFKSQIRNALPQGGLTTERYISACLTALAYTPKLMQCTPASVLKALMESARFGLEPNSPLGEAHLVPYGEKVEFLIAYRGMMKLAWNTGMIKTIDFDKVCENDGFVYKKGKEITFEHTPNMKDDRGLPFAYYAVAGLMNGGFALHIMNKDEIMKHGNRYSRSFSSPSSPWQTDFDAMAYKTVIRQLCDKKLPKATTEQSLLLNEAAHIDDIPDDRVVYHEIEEASTKIVKEVKEENSPLEKQVDDIVEKHNKAIMDDIVDNHNKAIDFKLEKDVVNEETGEVIDDQIETPAQTTILEG
jgi:recombination protein RecT